MKAEQKHYDAAAKAYWSSSTDGFRAAVDAVLALVPEQPESGWKVVYEQLATKLRDAERALAMEAEAHRRLSAKLVDASFKLRVAEERLALMDMHALRPAVGETCDWARAKADMQAHLEARWKTGNYAYRFLPGHGIAEVHRNGEWFRSSNREGEQASQRWTRMPDAPAEPVPLEVERKTYDREAVTCLLAGRLLGRHLETSSEHVWSLNELVEIVETIVDAKAGAE